MLLPIIKEWAATTTTGDRAELRDLPEDLPLWKEIAAEAETCLGTECPRYGDCFVTLMRQRAAESDVVIVNHHLLCADAAVRQSAYGEVIPSCPTLVVDEAHQLEDVATQYFGVAFSNYRVDDLVRDGERLLAGTTPRGCSGDRGARIEDIARAGARRRALAAFFAGLPRHARFAAAAARNRAAATPPRRSREHFEDGMMLAGALEGLEATLALLHGRGRAGGPSADDPTSTRRDVATRCSAAPASCATTCAS